MEKHSFVLPILLVTLISSISPSQSDPNEASARKRQAFEPHSTIDHGISLTGPGVGSVLSEDDESDISEEALFATLSFNDMSTTYNVELYYRGRDRRIRVRVLVGNQELQGLFNRFYDVDPIQKYQVFVVRDDNDNPLMYLHFGKLTVSQLPLDTGAMYDALEAFAAKSFPERHSPRIWIGRRPGLLKKTYEAYAEKKCLVNEEGQVEPFTLENLLSAYRREGIRAEVPDDIERISRDLVLAYGEGLGVSPIFLSDVNALRKYSSSLVDSQEAANIAAPTSSRDQRSQTDFWTCYTFERFIMGPGFLVCYTVGFQNGLLRSAERTVLGEDKAGAYGGYPELRGLRTQEKAVVHSNKNSTPEPTYARPSKTRPAMLRIVFVSAGVFLLVLAFVVRTCVRSRSKISTSVPLAEVPVYGTQKEKAANEDE